MPHDNTLELPKLKQVEDGQYSFTHNHSSSSTFSYPDMPTFKDRMEARALVEQKIRQVNNCMFFTRNVLEDPKLSGLQSATLKQGLKEDTELIERLEYNKPSFCSIL